MSVTLQRLLLISGLILFGVAALSLWGIGVDHSMEANLGLVAAGLACWIAAALP